MQTSRKKLPVWAKTVIAIAGFLAACILVIVLIWLPVELINAQPFNTAIIGGSQALYGIDAAVLSDNTEIKAVNLAAGPATIQARYDALKGAAERYDLDTVIIEISFSGFSRNAEAFSANNLSWAVPQMVTLKSMIEYSIKDAAIPWYEYGTLLSVTLDRAYKTWGAVLAGRFEQCKAMAGSLHAESFDMTLQEDPASVYNIHRMWLVDLENPQYEIYYNEDEVKHFKEMLNFCKDQGFRTIVVVLPVPEALIWTINNWDEHTDYMNKLLSEYSCEYYDFNLLRNRQKYFSDEYSFRDLTHLAGYGAEEMSRIIAQNVLIRNRQEIEKEDLFYSTYEEAKQYSIYRK